MVLYDSTRIDAPCMNELTLIGFAVKNSTPVTVAALSTVQLMVTALDGCLPRAMRAVLTEVF